MLLIQSIVRSPARLRAINPSILRTSRCIVYVVPVTRTSLLRRSLPMYNPSRAERKRRMLSNSPRPYQYMMPYFVLVILVFFAGITFAYYYSQLCGTSTQTAMAGGDLSDTMRVDTTIHPIVEPTEKKVLRIMFNTSKPVGSPLEFVPIQPYLDVVIGEPAMAFFMARNLSSKTLIGLSVYSTTPEDFAQYLAKIQCFCFEEQRFRPHELIELPVFFYIDTAVKDDPHFKKIDHIVLNYSFFPVRSTAASF